MPDPLLAVSTRRTPQSQPADTRQVANNAGGFTFTIDPIAQLRRFLVLGTTGGTFYVAESELTKDAAAVVITLAKSQPIAVVDEIVAISQAGRAPKQNPALFALAVVAGVTDDEGRAYALAALPKVARTGTHLFQFTQYAEQFRGWGRGLRKAVGRWYSEKDADQLAYQLAKYQQREGWSHRDLLRLAHPAAPTEQHKRLYDYACGREWESVHPLIDAVKDAHRLDGDVVEAIRSNRSLSWEMLPSDSLNDPKVWRSLLDQGIPQTALIRQLPRLTRLGLCDPMSDTGKRIAEQIVDPERLRNARVHPISVLIALRTYASGQSARGTGEWTPSRIIVDALDKAFYAAFGGVTPSNKRTLLALDVSGSMSFNPIAGLPITPREASAALALVTAAVEPMHQFVAFTSRTGHPANWGNLYENAGISELAISPRQRLDDVIRSVSDLPFGGTDCALPMTWALQQGKQVDTFVILTDSETWAGGIHPHQALQTYRQRTGINAKLIVVAMTPTNFSIADPSDAGMLDVAGFDASTPQVISDFSAGLI